MQVTNYINYNNAKVTNYINYNNTKMTILTTINAMPKYDFYNDYN